MARVARSKSQNTGRGSVILISTLLLGSAVIRLAFGAGSAFAQAEFDPNVLLPIKMAAKSEVPSRPDRDQMQSLLDALKVREARVEKREAQALMRAKALDVAQVEIERRIEALARAEERLGETLAHAETAAEEDLTRLTTVYENMKPKDAAALFNTMEPEFAAGFLARMRPDIAAKVMSGLDPQAAYSISAILAGRNAGAPKS